MILWVRKESNCWCMIKQPILVADDASYTRTIAPAMVTLGYRVVSARSGVEGLREYEAVRPAWVIASAQMPDVSEMMEAIRLRDQTIPFLGDHRRRPEKRYDRFHGPCR